MYANILDLPLWLGEFVLGDAVDVLVGTFDLCRLFCSHLEHSPDQFVICASFGASFGHRSNLSRLNILLETIWETW